MSFIQQFLACILCLLVVYFLKLKWKIRRLEYYGSFITGPPTLPIIGSVYRLIGVKSTSELLKIAMADLKKHGEVVKYWNGYELVILVSDPTIVGELLGGPDAIEKPPTYKFFAANMGGVFMAECDKWHKMRKFLNLTFNSKLMSEYITTFNKQANILLNILEDYEGRYFDPKPLVARCLIDNIIETHFGVESNEQTYNKGRLPESMSKLLELIMLRGTKVWLYPDFIYKRTDLYQERKKVKEVPSRHLSEVLLNTTVMEKSLKRFINNGGAYGNKLRYYTDMLVMWVNQKGLQPSSEILKHLASDIIIAGYDTSSANICQVLYFLALHIHIQEKVHAELNEIFKGRENSPVEKDDFLKMKYLDMVINESLRLCSPPFIMRKLHHDLKTGHGILPAESTVCVSIYTLHRDPKYWEHPDEFYPEHFLPENVASRPKYAYLPFSAGPRNCPGKLYSTWASKIILSSILRKYRVEMRALSNITEYKIVLMIEPINGYSLKFIPRV